MTTPAYRAKISRGVSEFFLPLSSARHRRCAQVLPMQDADDFVRKREGEQCDFPHCSQVPMLSTFEFEAFASFTKRTRHQSVMMATHLQLVLRNPANLFWSVWQSFVYLFLVFIQRILLPNACRSVTLRTEIARAILGSFLANFWDLLFKAPPNLQDHDYIVINAGQVPAVLIPPGRDLNTIRGKEDGKRKILLLYSHGGGYFFGEPLMYMSTYLRWIKAAARENVELTIVSVDYRTSSPLARRSRPGLTT